MYCTSNTCICVVCTCDCQGHHSLGQLYCIETHCLMDFIYCWWWLVSKQQSCRHKVAGTIVVCNKVASWMVAFIHVLQMFCITTEVLHIHVHVSHYYTCTCTCKCISINCFSGIAPVVTSARTAILQPKNEIAVAQFSQKADKVIQLVIIHNLMWLAIRKKGLWRIIILNKHLRLNARYSAILYRKPTKFGVQEDQLLVFLDTKFCLLCT